MRRGYLIGALTLTVLVSSCGSDTSSTDSTPSAITTAGTDEPDSTDTSSTEESTEVPTTVASTTIPPTTIPETPPNWQDVSLRSLTPDLSSRVWGVMGCCLSGFGGRVGSPPFVGPDSLADGEYFATLTNWDPTKPGVAEFVIQRLEDCDVLKYEECYVTGPGQQFEPSNDSQTMEFPLDDNMIVMVMSSAEDLSGTQGVALRTVVGSGSDLRKLLLALYDDYTNTWTTRYPEGTPIDQVDANLPPDSPFGWVERTYQGQGSNYGMVRWWRAGFPPLSYAEGSPNEPQILAPRLWDPDKNYNVIAPFSDFITRGGAFGVRNGVISFTYGWEFEGG